ncbi:MAG: flagellar biosynthetic protein FliQ [Polyangiaceae bacterium]|jgi:flagellar biosynthesis protein FliQ|nr:flagellar biosynthetic protein FliQ [Polyangiaceae bacterium]
MPVSSLLSYLQQALVLSLAVALPVLAVAAVVGLVMAVLQAATQVQDPTLAHLPRVVAVAAALAVFGPWMGRHIAAFAARALSGG